MFYLAQRECEKITVPWTLRRSSCDYLDSRAFSTAPMALWVGTNKAV